MTYGRVIFAQLCVERCSLRPPAACEAEVCTHAYRTPHRGVGAYDKAAFAGAENLGGMEADYRRHCARNKLRVSAALADAETRLD
jgi:hypothetical protein